VGGCGVTVTVGVGMTVAVGVGVGEEYKTLTTIIRTKKAKQRSFKK
jgi:hypothetical protein